VESSTDAADPRLRPECTEEVAGDEGTVVLVGVLHDHPASTYRVRTVLDAERPDILALELPPLAVPLVSQHASDERTPPRLGGEMSAAVQAADTDDVVGIDGPSVGFLCCLAATLYREGASLSTVSRTASAVKSVTATAVTRRFAATVAAMTTLQLAVDEPTRYGAGRADAPERQAEDEQQRIHTAQSMLQAFTPPPATAINRNARERHMADRLATLRGRGDVVAVVGMAHLDAVASRLRDA